MTERLADLFQGMYRQKNFIDRKACTTVSGYVEEEEHQ